MESRQKLDKSKWMLERERLRLPDPVPPHSEPNLSLYPAVARLFKKLDSQAGSTLALIRREWKIVAGETVAAHSAPGQLTNNILYVSVESSAWLAEITRFYADDLLRRIQDEFGPAVVKGVRFQVNPRQCRGPQA